MSDPATALERATPFERIFSPFQRFTRTESAGGIVLLFCTIIALVWANSPLGEGYFHLWEQEIGVQLAGELYNMSLHAFINDGLMVIFFFLVGLEIKREMLVGELASLRKATLPLAAALGGMLVPAAIYVLLNFGREGVHGWGVPMATDIAFALGILALMGPGIPGSLRVFLAALAIADDLGAVLVIALFYSDDIRLGALLGGGIVLLLMIGANRLHVRHPFTYLAFGIALWLAFLTSGVHATVAGVLAAMTIPTGSRIDSRAFLNRSQWLLREFEQEGVEGAPGLNSHRQHDLIQSLEDACEKAEAPLQRIEHDLQLWVAFGIIPLFALANAGVALGGNLISAFENPVTLGVVLGLVIGKPLGITLFAWGAVKAGLARLPSGVSWAAIHGVSWLGGIGFTMSLFIGNLAFGESVLLDDAKIGVLTASVLAGVVGYVLLRRAGLTEPGAAPATAALERTERVAHS